MRAGVVRVLVHLYNEHDISERDGVREWRKTDIEPDFRFHDFLERLILYGHKLATDEEIDAAGDAQRAVSYL